MGACVSVPPKACASAQALPKGKSRAPRDKGAGVQHVTAAAQPLPAQLAGWTSSNGLSMLPTDLQLSQEAGSLRIKSQGAPPPRPARRARAVAAPCTPDLSVCRGCSTSVAAGRRGERRGRRRGRTAPPALGKRCARRRGRTGARGQRTQPHGAAAVCDDGGGRLCAARRVAAARRRLVGRRAWLWRRVLCADAALAAARWRSSPAAGQRAMELPPGVGAKRGGHAGRRLGAAQDLRLGRACERVQPRGGGRATGGRTKREHAGCGSLKRAGR